MNDKLREARPIDLEPPGAKHDLLLQIILGGVVVVVVISVLLVGFGLPAIVRGANGQKASNTASLASQRFSHCQSVQASRARAASAELQIGIADLIRAGRENKPAAADAVGAITKAEAHLKAVLLDDQRIDSKEHPLCPFVAGHPELTPDTPTKP